MARAARARSASVRPGTNSVTRYAVIVEAAHAHQSNDVLVAKRAEYLTRLPEPSL